ncbi:MAG: hypothetical protein AABW67_02160 [Nanoarchaeota archaeon]
MITTTEQKLKVQKLESLEDLQLLINGNVINVVDERDRKNLAVFLGYPAPFLEFVCQDLDSKEHMIYFAMPFKKAQVENNFLKYNSKNLVCNIKIHKQTSSTNNFYVQLKNAGLSD